MFSILWYEPYIAGRTSSVIEASTITSLRPVAVVLLNSTVVISSPHSATIERPNSKCTSRSPMRRWLWTIENSDAKLGIGSFSGTS